MIAHQRPGVTIGLREHIELHGRMPALARGELIALVEAAGLRGRGGAAFPSATKLRAVSSGRKGTIAVANGAEGEPASAKDKLLLARAPHLVLDGLMMAAETVGAIEAIVVVERNQRRAAEAVRAAITERTAAGTDSLPIRLVGLPGRYVAGEESALVHFLNGGDAKPTAVPPRPFERGVGGRPTLVQNAETLGHMSMIARHGAPWFRELGTADEPGTALFTLSGAVTRRGVSEMAIGTRLSRAIEAAAGPTAPLRAFLLGGYFGTWVSAEAAADLRLSNASLGAAGASTGCGIVAALPEHACGLVESARVLRYLAEETAGQCGPCVHGLAAIADTMDQVARGRATARMRTELERYAGLVDRRGACRMPDGAMRFLRSSLVVFADEINEHGRGRCDATSRDAVLPVPAGPTRDWGWR